MIQFLGVHLGVEQASAFIVGRDLSVSASSSAGMLHAKSDPTTGITEIPIAEWVRAGSYAIQEAFLQLPVKKRKPWGLGLSGPSGWIALDVDYEPLCSVRVTHDVPVEKDLAAWLEANPRVGRRTNVILSPQDYFRFAISGSLAADVTHASRMDLLLPGESQWAEASAEERGIIFSWLPPVFDCEVQTGRLSEDGMRRTSLPGGCWLVAGAHETEATLLAGGALEDRKLWIVSVPGSSQHVLAYTVPGTKPISPPEGWSVVRSAHPKCSVLERTVQSPPDAASEELAKSRATLESAGYHVSEIAASAGRPDAGAALLAAIGSRLAKSLKPYYAGLGAQ